MQLVMSLRNQNIHNPVFNTTAFILSLKMSLFLKIILTASRNVPQQYFYISAIFIMYYSPCS